MGKESQKSALPTLFHFVRVKAAIQPNLVFKPPRHIHFVAQLVLHLCRWSLTSALHSIQAVHVAEMET